MAQKSKRSRKKKICSESIVQVTGRKECCLCRMEAIMHGQYGELPSEGLHKHHIIYGRGRRSISDQWGLWVWLCPDHHEFGAAAVHGGSEESKENDRLLKSIAQRAFEKKFGYEKWMELFTQNYI